MSDFVLHATVDSCYHGVQSNDIQGSDEGPTKQPFFSNLQVLPTECRSKEDLNSILLHSGLMLSLEVLQLFSR